VTPKQRHADIVKRAYELAATGQYVSIVTITNRLIREGYREALDALRPEPIRNDLRRACKQNWRGNLVSR
jgi:hypothetical protein